MDLAQVLRVLVSFDEDPAGVVEVPLRDGSPMWVRPITPGDRGRLAEGLKNLSERSRYMRFHSPMNELTESQLTYLTEVDHHDHEALIGIDPMTNEGLGVGRYIRLADEPHIAEAALTVVDAHQGRGVGTALLALLEQAAVQRGITVFRNYVLAENTAMLDIFEQQHGQITDEGRGLYRVDVPIAEIARAGESTPAGQVMSAFAAPSRPDMPAWVFPLLWARRWMAGAGRGVADIVDGARRAGVRAGDDDEESGRDAGQPSEMVSANGP